jgi:hypothetical protein
MRKALFCSIVVFLLLPACAMSQQMVQDTLPRISVRSISNRNIISWKNTYGAHISHINIQRSTDSLRNFTTIGSVLNPQNRENGFADVKPPGGKLFYRVFVAFEGGSYIYSRIYRPVIDSTSNVVVRDSVVSEPFKPTGFVPSKRVYTGKDNNVILNLPNAATKKYTITFFDELGNIIFEIPKVKEPYLILEKVNFIHAGWFFFNCTRTTSYWKNINSFCPRTARTASRASKGNGGSKGG